MKSTVIIAVLALICIGRTVQRSLPVEDYQEKALNSKSSDINDKVLSESVETFRVTLDEADKQFKAAIKHRTNKLVPNKSELNTSNASTSPAEVAKHIQDNLNDMVDNLNNIYENIQEFVISLPQMYNEDKGMDYFLFKVFELQSDITESVQMLIVQGKVLITNGVHIMEAEMDEIIDKLEMLNNILKRGEITIKALQSSIKTGKTRLEDGLKKIV